MIVSLFDIKLFTADGWDQATDDAVFYYSVKWLFDSMKKYNGNTILFGESDNVCEFEIYENSQNIDEDDFTVDDGFVKAGWNSLLIIPEFREELYKKLADYATEPQTEKLK